MPVAAPSASAAYTFGGSASDSERGGGERRGPGGADDALRARGSGQVVPGDLGGQRVEDRLALRAQLLERAEELVAAAVAAADRAQPRVARAVLLHPVELADEAHQPADVVALDVGVLDVGVAAALAEAALVEGQHAVPGVEEVLERRRVGGARAAPAVAVHDQRHPVPAPARRPARRASSRSHALRRARVGDAAQAAVGDRGGAGRAARRGGGGGAREATVSAAAARAVPAARAMRLMGTSQVSGASPNSAGGSGSRCDRRHPPVSRRHHLARESVLTCARGATWVRALVHRASPWWFRRRCSPRRLLRAVLVAPGGAFGWSVGPRGKDLCVKRSRSAFVALGLLVACPSVGLVAGCSSGDPQPKVAPSAPVSASASSSGAPSGPAEPVLPAAARKHTAAGAEAFVRFYIAVLNNASGPATPTR